MKRSRRRRGEERREERRRGEESLIKGSKSENMRKKIKRLTK